MPFLPKQAASSCLRRAGRFLDLADLKKLPIGRVQNDLRRMALVMAVAAIDSYMHGIVMRRVADVRRGSDLPKALARLEMPFSEFANLADASINAQRAGHRTRPWVQVKAALQKRLLKETFQSYDQVAIAFAIAGIEKAWSKVASKLATRAEDIKDRLGGLVLRRNQIVHEGDLQRASRPRKLRFNEIEGSSVRSDIDWVNSLIDAMEKVVTNP
jgi:RiboL-PSP-HEPN